MHACEQGWIFETHDGLRTVKDRCMICNEPPWYRTQRRQRFFRTWWPAIFVIGLYAFTFAAIRVAALFY